MPTAAFQRPRCRGRVRHLAVVFGDQLDPNLHAVAELDRERDAVLMMEVAGESEQGPSHRSRTVMFLSAMRHFATDLVERGYRVRYVCLDDRDNTQEFASEIERVCESLRPERMVCTMPGEWRVLDMFRATADRLEIPADVLDDSRFYTTPEQFGSWAEGRKELRLEWFYREVRKRFGVLVEDTQPVGGQWNYDSDNRETFRSAPDSPKPYTPRIDAITEEVIRLVERRLPDLPGECDPTDFRWPVTRNAAKRALRDFIGARLENFGRFQDAMWTDEPFLYHSLLSPALNLGLLSPRECVDAAVAAYENDAAPLNSVEGFVRQILGWREFIRGIYWTQGPDYRDRNGLHAHGALPSFFWDGDTDMRCMAQSLQPVLKHGYGHHIARLMVLANFALIAGIEPRAIGDWFYGMYVDAVDWVTTPNTIGMGVHADHAVVGSKPYAASGNYIRKMSNYCSDCRYNPKERTGEDACPFNAYYWDFMLRNESGLRRNQRMSMVYRNVDRLDAKERRAIRARADELSERFGIATVVPAT